MLEAQIFNLDHQIDTKNADLANILSQELQVNEALQSLPAKGEVDPGVEEGVREQQATLHLRKENTVRKLQELERDKQEKEETLKMKDS